MTAAIEVETNFKELHWNMPISHMSPPTHVLGGGAKSAIGGISAITVVPSAIIGGIMVVPSAIIGGIGGIGGMLISPHLIPSIQPAPGLSQSHIDPMAPPGPKSPLVAAMAPWQGLLVISHQ
jgi:hypothetical protein